MPLHENKGFKFFYDIVDDIIIQENKIDKHVSRFSVSDDRMAQLSPENQRMIRLNQINLQQHKNQPYILRSHEDPTNFSDTVVQRPPVVKRKNVRNLERKLQYARSSTNKSQYDINSTRKSTRCEKFSLIFFVTFFFMVIVWIFNLGYTYCKYFTQLKTLSPRLVQFYYIYSAICMFVTIVLMVGTLASLPSYWYLIFALFGIGHIVTSTVVLNIVVLKMDKDPSLKELKNNVKAHLSIDIINGILMVIGALGSHYCKYIKSRIFTK